MLKLYLRPESVDWLVRRGYWLALGGALLIALAIGPLHDIGFVSGLMLVLFGGCTVVFWRWQQERGLWMLALVALCAWLPLYAVMEWDAVVREISRPNPRPMLLGLDCALATALVWLQVRFLATVVRLNWVLFAQPGPVAKPGGIANGGRKADF
jgi:hypothetical protein